MTEKRFRVQEHCLRSSYGIEAENWLVTNDNHSVVLNDKAEAHMVANMSNDIIDKFNHLHEEKEELKEENEYLCEKIKENEWHWNTIDEDRDVWKYKCKRLEEENKELKEDNDIKFWKHELMIQWNKTQIISHELSLAIENGYEISEDFKKYLDELKERHEENMKKAERLKI